MREPCSCGCSETHVVARSRTFDGVAVELWSDGAITGRLGTYPPGVGKSGVDMRASRLAWEDAPFYEWRELGALIRAARRALAQQALPPAQWMRRTMEGESFRRVGAVVYTFRRPN